MGNAALCPSCHADKSASVRGHLQEVDRAPDDSDGDSEASQELGVLVSLSADMEACRGAWGLPVTPLDLRGGS